MKRGHLLNIISNFLENRTFQIKVNNISSTVFSQENIVPKAHSLLRDYLLQSMI